MKYQFLIQGLCPNSKFDNQYSWTWSMFNDRHSFRGYTNTFLFWDKENSQWTLQLYSNSSIYATLNEYDYPFGDRTWSIHGEPCYEYESVEVMLNINSCNEFEFNCQDGGCVPIEQRCDGRIDCSDKTGTNLDFNTFLVIYLYPMLDTHFACQYHNYYGQILLEI
jgi:hypothetical protein